MEANNLVNLYCKHFSYTPEVILDFGTHDLRDALILARAFPSAKVYAFEANPTYFGISLKNNIFPDRVTVYNKAVSDKDGTIDFYLTRGNIGASSILKPIDWIPHTSDGAVNKITVESTRLDTWAQQNNISKIDVMWMDAQGSELLCLHGLGSYISDVRMIQSEVGVKAYYEGHTLHPEIHDYLTQHGFEMIFQHHDWSHEDNVVYINKKFI